MEDLELTVKQTEKYNLVSLQGILKFDNCEDFLEDIDSLVDYEKPVFFDFLTLEYIDSSGVGALFEFVKKLQKINLHAYAFNLNAKVEQIFKLVKLSNFITIIEKDSIEKFLLS